MEPIIINLKQHTPMLHFQPELAAEGATLRATELKPKLDRYIIANYGNPIPKEWLVDPKNNKTALNYKLSVTATKCSEVKTDVVRKGKPVYPMFFGDGKTALSSSDPIELKIFCLIKSLREHIEKNIDWSLFFLANNFGTRQDKGYGSFYPDKMSVGPSVVGKTVKTENGVEYRVDTFFTVQDQQMQNWQAVFKRTEYAAKCMRGGINEGSFYFKSLMFAYAKYAITEHKKEKLFWDKRMIKEKFYPKVVEEHRKKYPNNDALKVMNEKELNQQPYMFRDFLGLSTAESWKIPYDKTLSKESNNISRMKSPLLFKPVWVAGKWYVFLLHREVPQGFKFSGNDKRPNSFIVTDKSRDHRITMVPYPDFYMSEYLNYIFGKDIKYSNLISIKNNDDFKAKKAKDTALKVLEGLKENYKPINTTNL